jgi:cytochrome P450
MLYRDYFIPKNSILLCNIWAMNRDPEVWGLDAHNFNPERHLDRVTGMLKTATASTHESHTSFGFGRRICPGRNVANDIIFMYASMVLWSLDLKPATDSAGNTVRIDIDGSIDDGLVV